MKKACTLAALTSAALLLAACKTEESEATNGTPQSEQINISTLSTASWVSEQEMANPEVIRVDNILTENNLIVLDMSGSMNENSCAGGFNTRADAAKDALFKWIAANPSGNIGLIVFNSDKGPQVLAPLNSGAEHGQRLATKIDGLRADMGTPLHSAITLAEGVLKDQFIRQSGSGTYRAIIITDGAASKNEDPSQIVTEIAQNPANPIEIHTIGFCIKGGHSLKDPNAVFYVDATSPEDIIKGLNATQGEAKSFSPDDLKFEDFNQ